MLRERLIRRCLKLSASPRRSHVSCAAGSHAQYPDKPLQPHRESATALFNNPEAEKWMKIVSPRNPSAAEREIRPFGGTERGTGYVST